MKKLLAEIIKKKEKLDSYQPLPQELVKNLDDWYRVELTYTSNAIEGNTLSRKETAQVVEKGTTVEGKTLIEQQEAINHAQAFDYIKKLAVKKREDLKESLLLNLHQIILEKIDDQNAGHYRTVPVRIAGSDTIFPNPSKVPILMERYFKWLKSDNSDHPIKIAVNAHFKLVVIHSFVDGNGRTARLIMNLLLMQAGYPSAIIRKEDRQIYIKAVEKGEKTDDLTDFYRICYQAIDRSLDSYLDALKPKKAAKGVKEKEKELLKIGQLSERTNETVPTIRYWTNQGLLKIAKHTLGGYMLFDRTMIKRAREIRRLQEEERLTIAEIQERLSESDA